MADSSSIVGAVWGLRYKPFIGRWWESVRTLNRKPDEIVLATNLEDPCDFFDSIPNWVDIPIVKLQVDSSEPNVVWLKALQATTKDWIVGVGIDDQYHPQALDFLESVEGDLVIDNGKFLQGGDWITTWDLSNKQDRRFAPPGFGPFRRNLMDLVVKGFECYWCDTAFYLLAVKHGVKVYKTDNFRIIHDLGYDHETMSGVNRDSVKSAWANDQLAKFIVDNGL